MTDSEKSDFLKRSLTGVGLIGLLLTVVGVLTVVHFDEQAIAEHVKPATRVGPASASGAKKTSPSGDTPIIISDGGSNSFLRFKHRNNTWTGTNSGNITTYTTPLTASSWRIVDLDDELINTNTTISFPNTASGTFSQGTFTVTSAASIHCANDNDPQVVVCTNTNMVNLPGTTVQVSGNTHSPVQTPDLKHFFIFVPQ